MRNLTLNLLDLASAATDELVAHFPGARQVPDLAPRCAVGGRPHPATDGRLCREHLEELGKWLHDIETEATALTAQPDDPDSWAALPTMATRWDNTGGGALASQHSPAVLDALVYADTRSTAHGHRHVGPVCRTCPTLTARRCTCPPLPWHRETHWTGCPRRPLHPSCRAILADRDEHDAHAERLLSVHAVLHTWAQRVRDERKLTTPTQHHVDRMPGVPWPGPVCEHPCTHDTCQSMAWWRDTPIPPTIRSERKILTRNLTWIARQPWVVDMRRELDAVRVQLQRLNGNTDDQPLDGWCYRLVDGVECGGELWPAEPDHDTSYETIQGTKAIACSRNPKRHRWEGVALASLSVVLAQQTKDRTRKGVSA